MNRNQEIEGASTPPAWMADYKRKRKNKPKQALNKCTQCGRHFTLPRPSSIHSIDTAGLFCTLRCAARYGTRAAEARLLRDHLVEGKI